MPALVVGGVTVPVAADSGAGRPVVEVGERARSFNGTLRSSVRAYKREWRITTIEMTRAAADTLETAIRTVPVSISGDIPGATVSCHGRVSDFQMVKRPAGQYVVMTFDLLEV